MGSTYYFLEKPGDTSLVLEWFRALEFPPRESVANGYVMLIFDEYGSLERDTEGAPDAKSSPVVSLFLPRLSHGGLRTMGEVHFLTTPISKIPAMAAASRRFGRWINSLEGGERWPREGSPYSYYLEGSIQNIAPEIYALPSGLIDLENQNYFISDRDSKSDLTTLCKKLRLRGVDCG